MKREMDDRRRFARLDTRLDVSYAVLPAGKAQRAVTKDISAGGICLFADHTLAQGTRLQVSMAVPGRKEPVRFTAEVVWSEAYEIIGRDRRERRVEVGVKFMTIDPKDQDAVLQHVILKLNPPQTPSSFQHPV